MRQTSLAAILLVFASIAPGDIVPASAQVTVDLKALDAVPPPSAPPVRPPAKPRPAKPNPAVDVKQAAPVRSASPRPQANAPIANPPAANPPASRPPLPTAPPPTANLPPQPGPTPQPVPALVPPPVSATAKGGGAPFAGGLRVTFGGGAGELSPASETALKEFIQTVPQSEATTFNVQAYSAGTAEDPSTARRLSLSRGLSVRSVLMGAGVPSSRIYVRALGTASGAGPADRADVTALGANAPATAAATAGSATP